MSYVEIRNMEENTTVPEFQPLKPSQKEKFIKGKLERFGRDTSETGWRELNIRLLHPEILTWDASRTPSRLPPQHGRIIGITSDISAGRKKMKFVSVDLAGTADITGVSRAQFGLGAVEITVGGDIIIDCTRLEKPGSIAQLMFPQNTFPEKSLTQPTLKHK